MAAVILIEMEAGSYGLLRLMEAGPPAYVLPSDAALLAEFDRRSHERGFGASWDKLLGWDMESHRRYEPDGARRNPWFAGQPILIATYGDSFTAGNEVKDEETWQVHLSRRLGAYVANYGTSAYGTDQALLKYRVKHADRAAARVVILGIWEGNLYRQFSRYRPFSIGNVDSILAFKPMFTLQDGGLRLIDNPAKEPPLDRDRFVAALAEAKTGDLWYSSGVETAFPYTPRLARLGAILGAQELGVDLWDRGILPANVWESPDAVRLMRAIIEDFLATAQRRGSRPVIFFVPDGSAMRGHGRIRSIYAPMLADLRRDHAADALFVDIAEYPKPFDRDRFNIRPFYGHTSDYGNRIIAEHLAAAMEERWGSGWVGTAAPAD